MLKMVKYESTPYVAKEGCKIKDFVQFAQKIVHSVSEILPFPISLTDQNGVIIGSTIPGRIGTIHTPSKEVIKRNDFFICSEEISKNTENVYPGIAVPLSINQETVGVLGIIGPPEEVKPYANLVKKCVELMWQETLMLQSENLETKTLEAFIHYLLLTEHPQHDRVKQYCSMLRIPYHTNWFCTVVDIGGILMDEKEKLEVNKLKKHLIKIVEEHLVFGQEKILSYLSSEKIVLIQTVDDQEEAYKTLANYKYRCQRLLKEFGELGINDPHIGFGPIVQGLEKVRVSYQEAENLIRQGKEFQIGSGIYSYFDWENLIKLFPLQINPEFIVKIEQRVRPLIEYAGYANLVNTFFVYCQNNLNLSQASERLFIHRNTLLYRLKKIETLTSLNMKSFEHCMILYLVLKNHQLKQQNKHL